MKAIAIWVWQLVNEVPMSLRRFQVTGEAANLSFDTSLIKRVGKECANQALEHLKDFKQAGDKGKRAVSCLVTARKFHMGILPTAVLPRTCSRDIWKQPELVSRLCLCTYSFLPRAVRRLIWLTCFLVFR